MADKTKSTMESRLAGLRFWHEVHGLPWAVDAPTLRRVRGSLANECLPPIPPRDPVRPADLVAIRSHLDFSDRAHVAIWAFATFAFWSMARSGELTVRSVSNPHATRPRGRDWTVWPASGDSPFSTLQLHLPSDKTHGRQGFDRMASEQPRTGICPLVAYNYHAHINGLTADAGAFSYIDRNGQRRELGKSLAIKTINEALDAAGRPSITGHALRIGGATAYVANGLSIEDVKRIGGWASDAALIYIRDVHALHSSRFADMTLGTFARVPIPQM